MPVWINAIGVGGIGLVYGYVIFWSLKRYFPPKSTTPLPISGIITLLMAIGATGLLGRAFVDLQSTNYIGSYGIGLALGVAINVALTIFQDWS